MTLHLVSFNTPPGGGEKMYYYCWLRVKVQVPIEVSTDTRDMQVFFHPSKDGNLSVPFRFCWHGEGLPMFLLGVWL